ncbi:MAG: hypothetical protein HPY85_05785 [Anaerolineae bacterium]|nr:hypothetical protein [Anaerolineae bacterium]
MENSVNISLWFLLGLLGLSLVVLLWTAIHRYRQNVNDRIHLQRRIHKSILKSRYFSRSNQQHTAAEPFQKMADEAQQVFQRLSHRNNPEAVPEVKSTAVEMDEETFTRS